MLQLCAALILAAAAPATAFWRMECRGVLGDYRIDPLVSPGEASGHVHTIQGSGNFGANVTNAELMDASCTSCLVTQDKSAYWHPALYFHDTTANTFELVGQVGGTLAYYLLNNPAGSNITAFPTGFRMISGDNARRTYTAGNPQMVDPPKSNWAAMNQTGQDILAQRAIGFNCLDYSKNPEGSLQRHFLPDKSYLDANCPDGIRFELMFPQCWNGKDIDSPNHRDHVAYPDLVMEGNCPSEFPIRFPGLFFETIWNTPAYADRTGEFVIANGDRQGYAYHGDFMMGWDEAFLQEAVDTCTSLTGEISACPLFDIQSLADATSCKMQEPAVVISDNVQGPASILPGNLPVFGDLMDGAMIMTFDSALVDAAPVTETAAYEEPTAAVAAAAVVSTTKSSSTSVATSSAVVANTDATNTSAAAPTTTSTSTSTTTTEMTSTTTIPNTTDNAVSTQYITNGNVVTEVLWYDTTVYVTEAQETEVVTTTVTPTANAVKARHLYRHAHRHARHL